MRGSCVHPKSCSPEAPRAFQGALGGSLGQLSERGLPGARNELVQLSGAAGQPVDVSKMRSPRASGCAGPEPGSRGKEGRVETPETQSHGRAGGTKDSQEEGGERRNRERARENSEKDQRGRREPCLER